MTLKRIINKNNFPTLFDDSFFGTDPLFDRNFSPRTNVVEFDNKFQVDIEVPGVKKDEIEITFKNDVLSVKGEKKQKKVVDDAHHYSFESSYGAFDRSWVVRGVDDQSISAEFNDGVLSIKLPKKEEIINKSKTKKIEIK